MDSLFDRSTVAGLAELVELSLLDHLEAMSDGEVQRFINGTVFEDEGTGTLEIVKR
jgi:hypothetical protein